MEVIVSSPSKSFELSVPLGCLIVCLLIHYLLIVYMVAVWMCLIIKLTYIWPERTTNRWKCVGHANRQWCPCHLPYGADRFGWQSCYVLLNRHVYLSTLLDVSELVCLHSCGSICVYIVFSICPSVCLSECLHVCMSVCLSACISDFLAAIRRDRLVDYSWDIHIRCCK